MKSSNQLKDSSPKVPREPRYSKSDKRFWAPRLIKRSGPDWQVRIGFQGHQERFPLGTPNREAAAAKARDIYLSLHAVGWEQTRSKFKPQSEIIQKPKIPTVGQFLAEVQTVAMIRPTTFTSYARKFRSLVADIAGIERDEDRFDYFNGGAEAWRKRVDAVKLERITPEKIARWRVEKIKSTGDDPRKQQQARTTAATIIRNSKALFSQKKVLRHLAIELPSPLPFEGIEPGGGGNTRYRSKINPAVLAQQAYRELRKDDPEAYKVFILALGAGLRRDEIDTLTWKQIDFENGLIRVETNAHTAAKSEDSEAEIDVDKTLLNALRQSMRGSKSEFVIDWPVAPRPGATYHHYRCHKLFRRLNSWLREKGVDARNPLHTLRKEFGSMICQQAGLFAASTALRHSSITLTRDYYLDKKEKIALPFGELLKGGKSK